MSSTKQSATSATSRLLAIATGGVPALNAFLQCGRQVEFAAFERGGKAEHNSREQRQAHREGEDPPIWSHGPFNSMGILAGLKRNKNGVAHWASRNPAIPARVEMRDSR